MSQKQFLYMAQGSKANIAKFAHLQSQSADLITLTYDMDIDEPDVTWVTNIYLPKSTWAEGRNHQLKYAINSAIDYLYYIFLDDDVSIEKGSYNEFENLLLEYQPAVGLPLCDAIKSSDRYVKKLRVQHPVAMDQLVQAYHRSVVKEKIALPFVTEFDSLSWWYSCEINQFLILRYYRGHVMQFNTIQVHNGNHNWNNKGLATGILESTYLGGVNEEGRKKIRAYIVSRFGEQPPLVNTLFHDSRKPKLMYMPELSETVSRSLVLLRRFKIWRLCKLCANLLTHPLLFSYHKLFNRSNLIDPYDFQRCKSSE